MVALLCMAPAGCAGNTASVEPTVPADLERWAFVELERVVSSPRERMGLRALRKLAGQPNRTLFRRPYAVAWDGDQLLVTDVDNGRVVRLTVDGRVLAVSSERFEVPVGVAACAAGVLVADSKRGEVVLLDARLGYRATVAERLQRPTGVACSGDRLYVVETGLHHVLAFRMQADDSIELVATIGGRGDGPGRFNYPTTLAIAGESLWVGDTLNFRLQQLGLDGSFRSVMGALGDAPGEMPRIKGLAADAGGNLWITDGYLDQVALYRRDGRFLTALGGRGTGAGEFSFPVGVAASGSGKVAVVDSWNRRVQIFRLLPAAFGGEWERGVGAQ